MATLINIVELESFEVAPVAATGAMPLDTAFEGLFGINEGTANLNIGEPAMTQYFIEESKLAFASSEGSREADLTVEIVGAQAVDLAPLIGAVRTAATASDPETMAFAPGASAPYRAVRMIGKNSEGQRIVVGIPRTRIISSFTGAIGRGSLRGFQLRSMVLIPVDASGEQQDYLFIEAGSPTE